MYLLYSASLFPLSDCLQSPIHFSPPRRQQVSWGFSLPFLCSYQLANCDCTTVDVDVDVLVTSLSPPMPMPNVTNVCWRSPHQALITTQRAVHAVFDIVVVDHVTSVVQQEEAL